MTIEEAKRLIADIEAGRKPEREVDVPDAEDGGTSVTLLLWGDGRVTWK